MQDISETLKLSLKQNFMKIRMLLLKIFQPIVIVDRGPRKKVDLVYRGGGRGQKWMDVKG
jgi:hypothetical protein